jgi:acyl-coenzyme A synthetase/AMP-(fatty) acid ligase
MNTHRNLENVVESFRARPGFDAGGTMFALTTISFDIAALELLLPLRSGGCVVIGGGADALDALVLADALERFNVSVLQATPTTWRLLAASDWNGKPGLQAWCGGEALPPQLARKLLDLGLDLWNVYGPTETTIWSTAGHVGQELVSVGVPIANTTVYVLNRWGERAPIGVTGEVFVGGLGLARGYHERPGLTADRFIPDCFGQIAGRRLYRTGDLGRWTRDGELEILGRADTQVKVRGVRVELGEVEHAIAEHPDVVAAVATTVGGATSEEIVAYVIPRDPSRWSELIKTLRATMGQRLPSQLVPTRYMVIDDFPRTPNGKIDRHALPPPTGDALSSQTARPPRSGTERAISAIWRDLLPPGEIGVEDNFFDVGGHSLLLVQLQARLRDSFSWSGSVVDLFRYPTIASQAQAITGEGAATTDGSDGSAAEAARLTAGQERLRRRFELRQSGR